MKKSKVLKVVFGILGLFGFLLILGGVGGSELETSEAGFYRGIIIALVGIIIVGVVALGNFLHDYFFQDQPL